MSEAASETREEARAQRDALARESAALDVQLAELGDLDTQKAALERERARVRVEAARERRRALPTLGAVRATGVCSVSWSTEATEPWDALRGDACARACGRCGQRVVDPRRRRAEDVRAALGVTSAATIFARGDGSVMAHACPRAAKRNRSFAIATCLGLLLYVGIVVGGEIDRFTPPPAASLQYLSQRSRLGRRPAGTPRQVAIAPQHTR